MKSLLLALVFTSLLPIQLFAEAPVVDESENFAILDDQRAAQQQPRTKYQTSDSNTEDLPLVQDDGIDSNQNLKLVDKVKSLQQELQELRGQLEVQLHELAVLKQQQLAFYKDIDARLQKTATQPTSLPQAKNLQESRPLQASSLELQVPKNLALQPTTSFNSQNPADEQISYLAAYDLVKNKRFDEALISMQEFVTKYPKSGYTANAQYWLGELYMVKRNYPQAIEHFETVLSQFPSSSKAAACSLKIGYALDASGKKAEARRRLLQVVKSYPDTPTAQLAATKLKTINAS